MALENLLKSLDREVLKSLKEEFTSDMQNNPLFSRYLKSQGFESGTLQLQRKKFLAEKYLPVETYDFEAYQKKEASISLN